MKNLILVAALVAWPLSVAPGQTADEQLTYLTLSRTPVGAFAPMLTNTLINRLQNGASLALRYGNTASGDFNNTTHAIGVTGVMPAGLGATFTITGGVLATDCTGCDPQLMLGVGGDIRLLGSTMGSTASSPLFTVSLDGELGYSNRDPGSFFSGYVGVPVALVQRGTGMQFVPFLTPGFAFTQTSAGGVSNSGSGLMVGGGLGIYNTESSMIVNVGIQHQFMNGARNAIGINLLFGGK
ncbi:MAG TPA: hypothetical protein VFO55_07115 [Gemmatimonadaceae bacterium]|nr:hypothetical protein [Gemmatimonadaceae bacterium]